MSTKKQPLRYEVKVAEPLVFIVHGPDGNLYEVTQRLSVFDVCYEGGTAKDIEGNTIPGFPFQNQIATECRCLGPIAASATPEPPKAKPTNTN